MIRKTISYAIQVLASFILVINLGTTASCEDVNADLVKKFLIKISSSRETLVQYKFRCTIKSGGGISDVYPDGLVLTCEFSGLDNHLMFIYDYSNCDSKSKKSTRWVGRSENYLVTGEAGSRSVLSDWNGQQIHKFVPHFDVRGLGFGFCADMHMGTEYISLMKTFATLGEAGLLVARKQKDNLWQLAKKDGTYPIIVIDAEKDYWPVEAHLAYGDWEIGLEEVEKRYLPTSFKLRCDRDSAKAASVAATIEWISVNEPFDTGKEYAAAIADEFQTKFTPLPVK